MESVYSVTREVWECGKCKWQWIPRRDKVPVQCPNRKCRVRLKVGVPRSVSDDVADFERRFSVRLSHEDKAIVKGLVSPASEAVTETTPGLTYHHPRSCPVYRCGQCAVAGVKDPRRGLE